MPRGRRIDTTTLSDTLDDATRSRLAIVNRNAGGGKLILYAVFDRKMTVCMVVVATCAEQAIDLCNASGMRDWTLGNTTCRSIVRNINENGPSVITAVEMKRS